MNVFDRSGRRTPVERPRSLGCAGFFFEIDGDHEGTLEVISHPEMVMKFTSFQKMLLAYLNAMMLSLFWRVAK
jgi:hypothetical protein